MIDDAIGTAFIHAPCILDEDFDPAKRKAAKAIIRGAILRWNKAGTGAVKTQQSMSYSQTIDDRKPRKVMFSVGNRRAQAAVWTDDDEGGAFSSTCCRPKRSSTPKPVGLLGGGCSCGAILTRGLPLWDGTTAGVMAAFNVPEPVEVAHWTPGPATKNPAGQLVHGDPIPRTRKVRRVRAAEG